MQTTVELSDETGAQVLRVGEPKKVADGYEVRITSDDDTEGHVMSVAWAMDGYLKVSARDERAVRVEVHDAETGRIFKAVPEDSDDVSAHAMAQHEWDMALEPDADVAGHTLSAEEVATLAGGAATAYLALVQADLSRERTIHTARKRA